MICRTNALLEPVTAGAPDDSPLRWTSKSVRKLAVELQALGHSVSPRLVNGLLHGLDYTLQANRKTKEGTQHPDRDARFHYLNDQVRRPAVVNHLIRDNALPCPLGVFGALARGPKGVPMIQVFYIVLAILSGAGIAMQAAMLGAFGGNLIRADYVRIAGIAALMTGVVLIRGFR